jgi:pimeloyl-ACP methyl ester carboxylesterase
MLLHDAPGTGLAHLELARELADTFDVFLPDLPGNGESSAPAPERSAIDAAADAVLAIADQHDLGAFTVAAIGCGGAVAARLAERRDPRLTALALIDPVTPDAAVAAAIAPALPLTPDGAHWLQAWMQVRDGQIYEPWFDGRVQAQRRTQGCFDAQWLHEQTCALMAARTSYHRLPQEAWRSDTRSALMHSSVPVRLLRGGDAAAFIRSTLNLAGDTR